MINFKNLQSYYGTKAQKRINQRINDINKERDRLRESGKRQDSDLKNTHLYPNKPTVIKHIRESSGKTVFATLTPAVAKSLADNMKLKPNFSTVSSDDELEKKLKLDNMEFLSYQEVYWGKQEEYKTFEAKYHFLLNLFLDLYDDVRMKPHIESVLIEYIPFARYIALDKVRREYVEFKELFFPNYKNKNIDVFAEAVYLFCSKDIATNIMDYMVDFLYSEYSYESKDRNGRFLVKTEYINFKNFEKALTIKLKDIVALLINRETSETLGKRVYDIVSDDFKERLNLISLDITSCYASPYDVLTLAGKPYMEVFDHLVNTSKKYIETLEEVQQDTYGDIEKEYFRSPLLQQVEPTSFFSEQRLIELLEEADQEKSIQHWEELEDEERFYQWNEKQFIDYCEKIEAEERFYHLEKEFYQLEEEKYMAALNADSQ